MTENIIVTLITDSRDENGLFADDAIFNVHEIDLDRDTEYDYFTLKENKQYYLDQIAALESQIASDDTFLEKPDLVAFFTAKKAVEQGLIDGVNTDGLNKYNDILGQVNALV